MRSVALPSIPIHAAELSERLSMIHKGDSYSRVSLVFGGEAYKTEHKKARLVVFWRFEILDAVESGTQYEIYMGEFEQEELVFGAILPRG